MINRNIYEIHDTPFGSYTMKFRESNYLSSKVYNQRILANMQELGDRYDLEYYDFTSEKKDEKEKTFGFVLGNGQSSDEQIFISSKEEEEKFDYAITDESYFLALLKKCDLDVPNGIIYRKDLKNGVVLYNMTPIKIEHLEGAWKLTWDDGNSYSVGMLKEFLQEVMEKEEYELEWLFKPSPGAVNECNVYFRKR